MKWIRNILIVIIIIILGIILFLLSILKPWKDVDDVQEEEVLTTIELGVTPNSSSSNASIVNNNIYINKGGIYNFKGILINGTIYIDTKESVTLNFGGVTLVNEIGSIIDNRKSEKVIINLEEDTNNILSDGNASLSVIKSVGDIFLEGKGSLLMYANGNNGITLSNGNLVINDVVLYVIARMDAFNVANEFLINSGTVLGLGNNNMQTTSSLSKQNTLLFNFNDPFLEKSNFVLTTMDYKILFSFEALRSFKTLTLSIPDLDNGTYRLFTNNVCDSKDNNGIYSECEANRDYPVKIGVNDAYIVNNKWNWYGSFDNIINNVDEIKG